MKPIHPAPAEWFFSCFLGCLLFFFSPFLCFDLSPATAAIVETTGHLRSQASLTNYPADHLLAIAGEEHNLADTGADIRFNALIDPGDIFQLVLGWESFATTGQSRRSLNRLEQIVLPGDTRGSNPDDRLLFDLEFTVHDSHDSLVTHRIDNLYATIDHPWGLLKIGRQPLTWGNGMLFNPLDLINPFAPSDVIRDYKPGADMVLYQWAGRVISDLQFALVPGRDPETGSLFWEETTIGFTTKLAIRENDLDLYLVKNRRDRVLGAGITSYLGDAGLRSEIGITFPESDSRSPYLSLITNLDYSWVWFDHNWYGFMEFYHNGLGADSVTEAWEDEQLKEKLQRGELFVSGRWYFDTMVQFEAHPLVNLYLTTICNLEDSSLLLQPRLGWDITSSVLLLVGLDLPLGGSGDEFGSISLPDMNATWGQGARGYLVLTWYY